MGQAAELKRGDRGEFSVWVDGVKVAEKGLFLFPSDSSVIAAVRKAIG